MRSGWHAKPLANLCEVFADGKDTICITIAAIIAETGILAFDACFPDSVIGVVANPKEADVGSVEYLLQSFKVRLQAKGKGSAQANINMGTFENERFPFPSVKSLLQNLWPERANPNMLGLPFAAYTARCMSSSFHWGFATGF